jgi:putative aminopeptidase FrvX
LAAARAGRAGPTLHLVWSVQEEYNLRGVLPAATALAPDIALQIDLLLACDTPDMVQRGEVTLGGGPGISLYSFHGRGTLNGVIPHPALVRLMEEAAGPSPACRCSAAQTGVLTDLSYIQFMGPRAWPASMWAFRCATPIPRWRWSIRPIWTGSSRCLTRHCRASPRIST